jgi:hypothetical protein
MVGAERVGGERGAALCRGLHGRVLLQAMAPDSMHPAFEPRQLPGCRWQQPAGSTWVTGPLVAACGDAWWSASCGFALGNASAGQQQRSQQQPHVQAVEDGEAGARVTVRVGWVRVGVVAEDEAAEGWGCSTAAVAH